jgi:hypothetical protein
VASDTFPAREWLDGDLDPAVDAETLDGVISELASQPQHLATTLALVVVHNGRVVREMYGPETDAATTLISWSMAKSITQALVGMAVGDGLLSIEDDHLFPEWENDDRATITLGNLLNMVSGASAWQGCLLSQRTPHQRTPCLRVHRCRCLHGRRRSRASHLCQCRLCKAPRLRAPRRRRRPRVWGSAWWRWGRGALS